MLSYPGKILLFGEYTLLYNKQALAIPFSKYSGNWNFKSKPHGTPDLSPWLNYIKELPESESWISKEAIASFSDDLNNDLWFDSNIPQGYGLGSSGALVAAWYGRYIEEKSEESLLELKSRFSKLESFFHGSSSGFDPLVSYTNRTIFQQGEAIDFLREDNKTMLANFFIIDSGIPRSTEPLVKWFRENIEGDQSFENRVKSALVPNQQNAIEAFISCDQTKLINAMKNISAIQMTIMNRLIPNHLKNVWNIGLQEEQYFMKLCGAGGGGVMLGMGKFSNSEIESISLA